MPVKKKKLEKELKNVLVPDCLDQMLNIGVKKQAGCKTN